MKEALASRRNRRGASVVVALVIGAGVLSLVVEGIRGRSAVKAAFPMLEGTLALAELERPVRIDRDARGLAHVSAESERDAFFGLGFVHAQDRLSQMLWLRRRARGRAAESLGQLMNGLEASHHRVQLILSQLRNRDSSRLEKTIHQLTLVATVFLPLSFITGLLGINVGGIPDEHNPAGFWIVCGLLIAVAIGSILVIRWRKWM